MYLFFFLPIFIQAQDITLKVGSKEYTVYENGKVKDEFNTNILNYGLTCYPPQSFSIITDSNNFGQTNQTLIITNKGDKNFMALVVQQENNEAIVTSTSIIAGDGNIQPNQNGSYLLQQQCPSKSDLNAKNYWVAITLLVSLVGQEKTIDESFVIVFSCDKSFRTQTFDWSLLILLTISTLLIAFLAKYTRIQSFRWKWKGQEFQGFEINQITIAFYGGIYAAGAAIVVYTSFLGIARYILILLACIFGTFGLFFVTSEVASLAKASSWVKRYSLVVATAVTIFIGLPYYFFQPWYLSDIMSMTFICLIVKFFRLKNFKFASLLMITNIVLDVAVSLVIHYHFTVSYNTLTLEYLNCPLELQLPLIRLQFNKNCAWISLFSQAIPGLFLSLAYRIDESKRTFTYGLAGFCSLIVAEFLWVLTTISITHSIPQTVFTYPILLLTLSLISYRRAEFKSFWFGDYLIDLGFYSSKIRGQSHDDTRSLRLLSGLEKIPDSKVQPSDI